MKWNRKETIGHGSFSTVSLATTSGNTKSFPSQFAVKSTGVVCSGALKNERYVLHKLGGGECSEIVRCYGEERTVENGEEVYNLFLEYACGGNLRDRVKKFGGGFDEFEVRRVAKSIVRGLCWIHECGFVHCDLKLDNVLVFGDGVVKISDLGLAKQGNRDDKIGTIQRRLPESSFENICLEDSKTIQRRLAWPLQNEIRGTPLYMAPESVSGCEFESPVDIWGLGCCVVEMFSGETAWCLDTDVMSLMVKICYGDEIPNIPVGLSEEGKDFLMKCFVKNPAERWTAKMLLEHPFLAVDDDLVLVSPRDPFEFPDWNSVQSPVCDLVPVFSGMVVSVEERFSGLVTEKGADWLDSCDWVNVR